jgi:HSP20 family protein
VVEDEVREPLVDVFDEEGPARRPRDAGRRPGGRPRDLDGRTLTLSAERADRKYRKAIEVPEGTMREQLSVACKNGIVEIACAKPRA